MSGQPVAKRSRTQAFLLIADGFDELEVIYFLHTFRRRGINIKSVSLFDRLVSSNQGVALRADLSLADISREQLKRSCLILPAGGTNGEKLRHDARMKRILETVIDHDGYIVVTDRDCELAVDVDRILHQAPHQPADNQRLRDFVDDLAWQLTCA